MRLHTDFHDYYDNAVGYGIDEKVHYNRFSRSVDIQLRSVADRPVHPRSGILGFCGSLLPFVSLRRYDKKHNCDYVDEYDGRVIETFYAFGFEEYRTKETDWYDYSDDLGYFGGSEEIKLKQFFLDWKIESDDVFIDQRCPVWSMQFYDQSPNGTLNPCLKDFGFERIKDRFSAFQDISMYLANILIEQKPVATIDDKHRIEQHGFDLKKSFRNTKRRK